MTYGQIKDEYLKDEIPTIQAIEQLEKLGFPPKNAEELVDTRNGQREKKKI